MPAGSVYIEPECWWGDFVGFQGDCRGSGNSQRKIKQTDGFLKPINQTTKSGDKGGRPAALWTKGPAEKLSPPLSRPDPA